MELSIWSSRLHERAEAEDTYILVSLDNRILTRLANDLRLAGAERMWQRDPSFIYEPISRLAGPREAVKQALRVFIDEIREATGDQSLTVGDLLTNAHSLETGLPGQRRDNPAAIPVRRLTPEEIGIDLDGVYALAYRRPELEGFIDRINSFQRETGQRRLEKGTRDNMTNRILNYFGYIAPEDRRPEEVNQATSPVAVQSQPVPESPLYSLVKRLLSLNSFNSTVFINKCIKSKNFALCQRIFEEGLNQYLRQPLEKGKPLDKAVTDYLDLTFLPEFLGSTDETKLFERRQKRVLMALKKLNPENPAHFWADYCHEYLELEVDFDKAEFLVQMLDQNWQNNSYFSLDMILYSVDHKLVLATTHRYLARTLNAAITKSGTEIIDYILATNRRFQLPKLEKTGTNNDIFFKDLSLILQSCFVETYYPTPEGLVTIPYNIDLAMINLGQLEEMALDPEYQGLLRGYKDEFTKITTTLSSFLYSLI